VNKRNLVDLLLNQADRQPTKVALRVKCQGVYQDISWGVFLSHVVRLALALHRAGLKKGDRIAILSENRPEWAYADLAILAFGGIVVPIYPTASPKEMEYVLNHCEATFLFTSTADQFNRIKSIEQSLHALKKVIIFDDVPQESDKVTSLARFINSVNDRSESVKTLFQSLVDQVKPDDLATIIYTSGTTGPAKGVMLSHQNFLINCYDSKEALPLFETDVSLSFLPLSHVFERMGGYYLVILCGCTIAYAENMTTVPENLIEVHPTVVCCVPRFFEKMYARIQDEVARKGFFAQMIFRWAIRIGKECAQFRSAKQSVPFWLQLQRIAAQKLVYSNVYKRLGGRLRYFISGGAPLAKELAEFFYSAGVLILEGYGLTETSPVLSVNRWDRFKFGSVGLPLQNVKVKIAEDGEVLAQGPSIMAGYYKNETATQEALRDGWFHTGDFGKIDEEGFLYITGRKKDLIVTSGGKNISPQNIENSILGDAIFSQIVVVGDKHNFITALIVPNFDQLKAALKQKNQGAGEMAPGELVQMPEAHSLLREHLEERTKDFAPYEKIKYFTLLTKEFSQEKGEMTLTLKIKRSVVNEHFRNAIEHMYRETESGDHERRNRIFFVL